MRLNRNTGMAVLVAGLVGACSSSSSGTANDAGHDANADSGRDGRAVDAPGTVSPDAAADGADAGPHATSPDATIEADAGGDSSIRDGAPADTTQGEAGNLEAAAPGAQRVLVTYTGGSASELVAVNVATKAVDGRLGFLGFGITDARNTGSLFLLEQNADIVAGLEVATPWRADSTWNMAMADAVDGGSLYSGPSQVIELATKTYVLRYQRNQIGIIDTNGNFDGGTPTGGIDLSQFVQGADSDGLVEMVAAAYSPGNQRLYVVLANVNQAQAAIYGTVVCTGEVSTVIAIDTQTDAVVSLGGTGPGGSIALSYYNPIGVVYDAALNRLLIASAGCYAKPVAPGTALGSVSLRGVEAIGLVTGKSTPLLALSAAAFPSGFNDVPTGFVYIDATHAVLGFDNTGEAVYSWNPSTATLGAAIPNAPDVFTYDGNGHLLGTRVDKTDAGVVSTSVVSVAIPGGASTTLATNVTSLTGVTYVGSVDVWPHP